MELESIAIADILELKALLNSGAFNSLLMVSVQGKSKENTSVFVFQCEDIRVRRRADAVPTPSSWLISFFSLLPSG